MVMNPLRSGYENLFLISLRFSNAPTGVSLLVELTFIPRVNRFDFTSAAILFFVFFFSLLLFGKNVQ